MNLILHPTSETDWLAMRVQDVTSTESSALFDACPYLTRFELWHRKRDGVIVSIPENARMKWGKRDEPVTAAGVAEDEGWSIRPMKEYMRDSALRMGASFDYRILANPPGDSPEDSGMEIKHVHFDQLHQWIIERDYIEAPPHIEIQVQHQMAVNGLSRVFIVVRISGVDVRLIERRRDERMIGVIRAKVAEFWESVDNNLAPSPDWSRDSKAVIQMYSFAEPGRIFDARGDAGFATTVQEYIDHADAEKAAKAGKETAKAQILMRIGEAEKVIGDGWTVSAGIVGPAHVEYEREAYRNFRVNRPRGKKNEAPG